MGRPVQEETGLHALSGDKITASRSPGNQRGDIVEMFRPKPAHIFGREIRRTQMAKVIRVDACFWFRCFC